jgi:hypothetical protein
MVSLEPSGRVVGEPGMRPFLEAAKRLQQLPSATSRVSRTACLSAFPFPARFFGRHRLQAQAQRFARACSSISARRSGRRSFSNASSNPSHFSGPARRPPSPFRR